jgi:group II intron reverse transcriptase/maturase
MKGMRMQKANQILQAVRKLGEQGQPLTRIYRSLYCEELFIAAYGRIYRNDGAMTPGTVDDTVDGMNLTYIHNLIEELRCERYRFRPARRQPIPKVNGGTRPLGVQNFTEKLVGEVLRMLLEAYYEPRFRNSSHGFRPNRGCHTALEAVKKRFIGTSWFIEGDIKGCFDTIDHEILLAILARDIHDGRLLNLIRMSLTAGVLENWTYHETHSGTPQGSVLSPLLANIYLNELDSYIEDELTPAYTKGARRAYSRDYQRLDDEMRKAWRRGDKLAAHQFEQQKRQTPSQDTHDPNFRRLNYVRYADDFILGFIGPKQEASAIRTAIGDFLHTQLKLTLSPEKTLITHARTQHARFLGYAVSTYQVDTRHMPKHGTHSTMRAANGKIRLGIPYGLITEHVRRYQRNGKPIHEADLLHFSDAHIILTYQMRYRGLAEYYQYAVDLHRLGYLKWFMETALTKTLAHKLKISVREVYRKYHGKREVNGYTYKTLQVEIPTTHGTSLIYWGAVPLRVVKAGSKPLVDTLQRDMKLHYNDLTKRLCADKCELCGATGDCEIHHIRKLSNLKQRWAGHKEPPPWVKAMIRIQRKTLVVCRQCHVNIHAGKPIPDKRISTSGEPDDAKVSSPVRRGDCGKAH